MTDAPRTIWVMGDGRNGSWINDKPPVEWETGAVPYHREAAVRELREAAQAVISRWDTPKWKDAPATGEYIDALRAALAKLDGGAA